MSHNYLLDTYRFLQERMDKVQTELTDAHADAYTKQYTAGRIEAICAVENILKERYEIKMPRRLRQQLQQTAGICRP